MFIDLDFPVAVSPEQPVRIFLQHFSCDAFDDANFSRHAIHCPESIARSVLKRRAEYFYGRLCAQRVLGAAGYSDVQVLTGASREPLWPAGIRGSISHSDGIAAAATLPAAGCRGLGIDIASPIRPDMWNDVVGIAISPQEYQLLANLAGSPGMERCLALVFSAKESFFKALFDEVRRIFDFDVLELCGVDFEQRLLRFVVKEQVCPYFPVGAHCAMPFRDLPDGDVLTVFSWR